MDSSTPNRQASRSRDPERTKGEILAAALAVFAENGYDGARIQQISHRAGCNPRLIYHYFGSKDDLYLAALRKIYAEIRSREEDLNLAALAPREAILRLAEFTFDFFDGNAPFVSITRSENLLGGQYIRQLPEINRLSNPLIEKIAEVLKRGEGTGEIRPGIDPMQLYISIVALSAHHINAAHTLSATFGTDLTDPKWRQTRRAHVVTLVAAAVSKEKSQS
ncbi:TetR/AcrR family transcriptional regulator [Tritonibacter horizontis]|uniref:HTH-type transcriptional repressor NicS n=1 Tax=Tritonibacter horizontis TaxID=1768241 RepID=A0A132C327_9RHOB|nr:TetR/AcrR family transcriptional regulator [Tritonibacter horizontis]KUP94632.1 HTH-type transcriptional repressor NicS [Tritonibacter horizontis]